MQLRKLLRARKEYGLAEGELVHVAEVENKGCCVLWFTLPDERVALTALNFGREAARETLELAKLPDLKQLNLQQAQAVDIVTGERCARLEAGKLSIELEPLSGRTLVIEPNE
jgi:hypothetical protein